MTGWADLPERLPGVEERLELEADRTAREVLAETRRHAITLDEAATLGLIDQDILRIVEDILDDAIAGRLAAISVAKLITLPDYVKEECDWARGPTVRASTLLGATQVLATRIAGQLGSLAFEVDLERIRRGGDDDE